MVDTGDHPEEGDAFMLLVPTHDSITFQFRKNRFDLVEMMNASMQRPWPQLDGLRVGTSVKVGERMNEMEVWNG